MRRHRLGVLVEYGARDDANEPLGRVFSRVVGPIQTDGPEGHGIWLSAQRVWENRTSTTSGGPR
eukprot:4102956-Lingulodinium_polyedra.AAC.1